MHMLLVFLVCTGEATNDSVAPAPPLPAPNYTSRMIVNGAIGTGFAIGAFVLNSLGNKAYDEYKTSGTLQDAAENYDRAADYDNLRNICAVGAGFFIARALYYQLKKINRQNEISPALKLDLQGKADGTIQVCIKRVF